MVVILVIYKMKYLVVGYLILWRVRFCIYICDIKIFLQRCLLLFDHTLERGQTLSLSDIN